MARIDWDMTPGDMVGPSLEFQREVASCLGIALERVTAAITLKRRTTPEGHRQMGLQFQVQIDGRLPKGKEAIAIKDLLSSMVFIDANSVS